LRKEGEAAGAGSDLVVGEKCLHCGQKIWSEETIFWGIILKWVLRDMTGLCGLVLSHDRDHYQTVLTR
jgi:hypothetical protein